MRNDVRRCRKNGMTKPYHYLQIISWVLFALNSTLYLVFAVTAISNPTAQIILASCFVFFGIIVLVCGYMATITDCQDQYHIISDKENKQEKQETTSDVAAPPVTKYECRVCGLLVGKKAKHCMACNKCIGDFDHHCDWLNNCIGGRNYRWFVGLLISIFIFTIIAISTCILGIVELLQQDEYAPSPYLFSLGDNVPFWVAYVTFAYLALCNAALLVLITNLLIVHVYLMKKGITTYEYIVRRIEEERKMAGSSRPRHSALEKCEWVFFKRTRRSRRKEQVGELKGEQEWAKRKTPEDAENANNCSVIEDVDWPIDQCLRQSALHIQEDGVHKVVGHPLKSSNEPKPTQIPDLSRLSDGSVFLSAMDAPPILYDKKPAENNVNVSMRYASTANNNSTSLLPINSDLLLCEKKGEENKNLKFSTPSLPLNSSILPHAIETSPQREGEQSPPAVPNDNYSPLRIKDFTVHIN